MKPISTDCNSWRAGFTLLELLVVCAIMGGLLVFAVPAVGPLLMASKINKSASLVNDELNYAHQLALAQNMDVEVRFYQLPSKSGGSDLRYRALRLFAATNDSLSKRALSAVKYFPDSIIMTTAKDSSGNLLSTLLDVGNGSRIGLVSGIENLPSAQATPYVSFMFRSTGGTTLSPVDPPLGNWYVTICADHGLVIAGAGIPANYCTVQIEPVTGRARSYRP